MIVFEIEASYSRDESIPPPKTCNTGRLPKQQSIQAHVNLLCWGAEILIQITTSVHEIKNLVCSFDAIFEFVHRKEHTHENGEFLGRYTAAHDLYIHNVYHILMYIWICCVAYVCMYKYTYVCTYIYVNTYVCVCIYSWTW